MIYSHSLKIDDIYFMGIDIGVDGTCVLNIVVVTIHTQ